MGLAEDQRLFVPATGHGAFSGHAAVQQSLSTCSGMQETCVGTTDVIICRMACCSVHLLGAEVWHAFVQDMACNARQGGPLWYHPDALVRWCRCSLLHPPILLTLMFFVRLYYSD